MTIPLQVTIKLVRLLYVVDTVWAGIMNYSVPDPMLLYCIYKSNNFFVTSFGVF